MIKLYRSLFFDNDTNDGTDNDTNAFPTSFIIYKDKVVCKNANKPHQWGNLKPGSIEPFPKNPHIAQLFTQMGRSEELGTGIKNVFRYNKMYSNTENNDFIEDDVFSTSIPLQLFKEVDGGLTGGLIGGLTGGLNTKQTIVLNYIKENPGIKTKEMSISLKIPIDSLDKYIKVLVVNNNVERKGSKKTGGYYTV